MNLTDNQLDALREIINIGVGRSAGMLSEMLQKRIILSIPDVAVIDRAHLETALYEFNSPMLSAVRLGFRGQFNGMASLMFPSESVHKLVAVLTDAEPDDDNDDMDELRIGTINEVGNIVINGVMGTLSNMLSIHFRYSLPNYLEVDIPALLQMSLPEATDSVLVAKTRFDIQELQVNGLIYLVFEVGALQALVELLDALGD